LKAKEDNDMIALTKRAASLAELIAAGALIVGLLQADTSAATIGVIFTALTFGATWFIDRCERRAK
jgi:hypothetical protein